MNNQQIKQALIAMQLSPIADPRDMAHVMGLPEKEFQDGVQQTFRGVINKIQEFVLSNQKEIKEIPFEDIFKVSPKIEGEKQEIIGGKHDGLRLLCNVYTKSKQLEGYIIQPASLFYIMSVEAFPENFHPKSFDVLPQILENLENLFGSFLFSFIGDTIFFEEEKEYNSTMSFKEGCEKAKGAFERSFRSSNDKEDLEGMLNKLLAEFGEEEDND